MNSGGYIMNYKNMNTKTYTRKVLLILLFLVLTSFFTLDIVFAHGTQTPSFDAMNDLKPPHARDSLGFQFPSYSSKSSPSSLRPTPPQISQIRITPGVTAQTTPDPSQIVTVTRGTTLQIAGVLKGGYAQDPWDNEQVKLYWNTTQTDIENAYSNSDTAYLNAHYVSEDTTSSSGNWQFNVNIPNTGNGLLGGLGRQTFVVYFEGNLQRGRGAGTTGGSTVLVIGTINYNIQLISGTESHPGQTIQVQATLKFDNNTAVSAPSGISVNFEETRVNLTTTPPPSTVDFDGTGTLTYSSSVGTLQSGSGSGTVTIKSNFTQAEITQLLSSFPNFQLSGSTYKQFSVTITKTETINFYIQDPTTGLNVTQNNLAFNYGDILNFTIRFTDDTTTGGNPISDTFYAYYYYNGVKTDLPQQTTSATTGNATFSVTLSKATFAQPYLPITFYIELINKAAYPNLSPPSGILSIKVSIIGVLSSLTANLVNDTSAFYYKGDELVVTGTVYDEDNNPAYDAIVKVHLTGVSSAVSPYVTVYTFANGTFTAKLTIPNLSAIDQDQYSITIEVVNRTLTDPTIDNLEPHIWVVYPPPISTTTPSINLVQSLNVTLESFTLTSSSFDTTPNKETTMFNNTMGLFLNNNTLFVITIRDQAGRIPIGSKFFIKFPTDQNSIIYTVDNVNNGVFTIDPDSNGDVLNLLKGKNHKELTLDWIINYGQENSVVSGTIRHSYTLTGPDLVAPVFVTNSLVTTPQDNLYQNGQRVPQYSVTISVRVDDGGTYKTGISEVVLYYRVVKQLNDTTTAYQTATMNYIDTNLYSFELTRSTLESLVSNLNGTYLQFYFVAYDYAGYGLDNNDQRSTTPLYDPNVRNSANFTVEGTNGQTPFDYMLGDHEAPTFDPLADVSVNGVPIGTTTTETQLTNMTITVNLVDNGGIKNVTIVYRLRTVIVNETGGVVQYSEWSQNYTGKMVLISGTIYNGVWSYTIPVSLLDYNVQFDIDIIVEDSAGNIREKGFYATNAQQVNAAPRIIDTQAPTFNLQAIQDSNGNTIPAGGTVLANQTVMIQLQLNDTGIGVDPNSVTIFVLLYQNGSLVSNTTVIPIITQLSGKNYTVTFFVARIPEQLSLNDTLVRIQIRFADLNKNQATTQISYTALRLVYPEAGGVPIVPEETTTTTTTEEAKQSRTLILIWVFLALVIGSIIYYNKENILSLIRKEATKRRVEGTLQEFMEEIRRLGAEGKFRRAILLTYEALERIAREKLNEPRLHSQTVREYVSMLSEITDIDWELLFTIALKFEKAKYGSETLTYDDFDEAVKALHVAAETIIYTGGRQI